MPWGKGVGVATLSSYMRNAVEHNTLLNTSWAGVTVGWMGWGKGVIRPSLGGNRIVGNRIAYVNLITGDGGPICESRVAACIAPLYL